MKDNWSDTGFFCVCCEKVVTQRKWDNGFVVMRCQCIRKAGHLEVSPSEQWIDKRCQGNEQATCQEMMQANSSICFD